MAMEAISLHGKQAPPLKVFVCGIGGNNKPTRSVLRHNFMGGHTSKFGSPDVLNPMSIACKAATSPMPTVTQ